MVLGGHIINNKYLCGQRGGNFTSPSTRQFLLALADSIEAEEILELGTAGGHTAAVMAYSGASITTIDDDLECVEDARKMLNGSGESIEILQFEALEFLRSAEDESYDLIYVDDDHNEDHVREEAKEVGRVLRQGGFAVFHDTRLHNLWKVLDTIFADWERIHLPSFGEEDYHPDYGMGLVGRPRKEAD